MDDPIMDWCCRNHEQLDTIWEHPRVAPAISEARWNRQSDCPTMEISDAEGQNDKNSDCKMN